MATTRAYGLYIMGQQVANMTTSKLSVNSGDKQIETSAGTVSSEGKDTTTLTFSTVETIEKTGVSALDLLDIMKTKKVVTISAMPVNTKSVATKYKCTSLDLSSDVAGGTLEGSFTFSAVVPSLTVA